ncbi:PREDICTED: LOW QUALITY PROTEIN: uncharacterized protein LOC104463127 [Pterocles gutturalis]|nr:PREDICTED: LOW QUALITY PROTEIN: uncharacterized protein LOC104463127 [Pterocles gutturalis]
MNSTFINVIITKDCSYLVHTYDWTKFLGLENEQIYEQRHNDCLPRDSSNQCPKQPKVESPATIVVGRAYSTTVRTAGQVPEVVKNPVLKLNMNMDESFTGLTEMFQTPENKSGKMLPLATVEKTDFTTTRAVAEISDLHTPEESGEMMVSPLNSSDAPEQKQDSPGICHFLREESVKSMFDAISTKTPEKIKAMLEENISVASFSIIPEKQAFLVKSGTRRRTPKQKLEPVEVVSGNKQFLRTTKQKTPKQRSEPDEVLSGIKQLRRTLQQKPEPVEVLSGIKESIT